MDEQEQPEAARSLPNLSSWPSQLKLPLVTWMRMRQHTQAVDDLKQEGVPNILDDRLGTIKSRKIKFKRLLKFCSTVKNKCIRTK